jgi:hypothetical protein
VPSRRLRIVTATKPITIPERIEAIGNPGTPTDCPLVVEETLEEVRDAVIVVING